MHENSADIMASLHELKTNFHTILRVWLSMKIHNISDTYCVILEKLEYSIFSCILLKAIGTRLV